VPRGRAVFALAGVGLLVLFALAALLVGDHLAGPTRATGAHTVSTAAGGEPDHALPIVHVLRQQPTTRTRTIAFVVFTASMLVVAAAACRIVRSSPGALRTLRLGGRPPGRAPPRLHIA
jgi:hypothetical protein